MIKRPVKDILKKAAPDLFKPKKTDLSLESVECQKALVDAIICVVRDSKSKTEALLKLNDFKTFFLALEDISKSGDKHD